MRNIAIFFAAILWGNAAIAGGVVVSIKPIHSLVAAVMEGDGNKPVLLVDGKQSLHNFSLRPSQVKELNNADVVFFIDRKFEVFLDKTLSGLPDKAIKSELSKLVAIPKMPPRMWGDLAKDGHKHEGIYDYHLWMSPLNAKTMVMEIARQLALAYPKNREIYFANAKEVSQKLDSLNDEIEEDMNKLRGRPYVVFHDAYQYFDSLYGLQMVGALTLHPERGVNARHLSELRKVIKDSGTVCVFREPEFDGRVVENLLAGTNAKSGILDPEAALVEPGPDLYFKMMRAISDGLVKCLKV